MNKTGDVKSADITLYNHVQEVFFEVVLQCLSGVFRVEWSQNPVVSWGGNMCDEIQVY